MDDLEIGQPELKDARKVWRIFASHYYYFAERRRALWLDYVFQDLFGFRAAVGKTADHYYDTIIEKLKTPEFLPRALYEKFNFEVLATTDSPLDSLKRYRTFATQNGRPGFFLPFAPIR